MNAPGASFEDLERAAGAKSSIFQKLESTWTKFRKWTKQRRVVLSAACALAAATLVVNLVATLYSYFRSASDVELQQAISPMLFLGDCSTALDLNLGLHVVINVISTLLLSSSNMFMQALLAPTRTEVKRYHMKQRSLNIGVPSVRNLRAVPWRKRVLWFVLAISSLPLHLVYNSAIYLNRPLNHITMHIVTPEFLTGGDHDLGTMYDIQAWRRDRHMFGLNRTQDKNRDLVWQSIGHENFMMPGSRLKNLSSVQEYVMGKRYQRTLDPFDCLTEYSQFNSDRADVVFISDYDYYWNSSSSIPHYVINKTTTGDTIITTFVDATNVAGHVTNSLLYTNEIRNELQVGPWNRYEWLCGNTNSFDCRLPSAWKKNPSIIQNWNILGYKIDKCLVTDRSLQKRCSVSYSLEIMIAVCCVNALKLICMLFSINMLAPKNHSRKRKPLLSIGDALASFLEDEDDCTKHFGIRNAISLKQRKAQWTQPTELSYSRSPVRYAALVSKRRLFVTFGLFLGIIGGGIGGAVSSFNLIIGRSGSASHIWDIPLGAIDGSTFGQLGLDVDIRKSLYYIIFFANIWQLLLSFLYVSVNILVTYWCVEKEWQSYGKEEKAADGKVKIKIRNILDRLDKKIKTKMINTAIKKMIRKLDNELPRGLRVSVPEKAQRSTYFLSLPWQYALFMMGASTTLHWLLSQSIFLTALTLLKPDGSIGEEKFAGAGQLIYLGSSPRALMATISMGIVLMGILVGMCFRKSKGILPCGGSCSAIISAACHRLGDDKDAAIKPVQWGEVIPAIATTTVEHKIGSNQFAREERDVGYRHCCFTSYEVVPPTSGTVYR